MDEDTENKTINPKEDEQNQKSSETIANLQQSTDDLITIDTDNEAVAAQSEGKSCILIYF